MNPPGQILSDTIATPGWGLPGQRVRVRPVAATAGRAAGQLRTRVELIVAGVLSLGLATDWVRTEIRRPALHEAKSLWLACAIGFRVMYAFTLWSTNRLRRRSGEDSAADAYAYGLLALIACDLVARVGLVWSGVADFTAYSNGPEPYRFSMAFANHLSLSRSGQWATLCPYALCLLLGVVLAAYGYSLLRVAHARRDLLWRAAAYSLIVLGMTYGGLMEDIVVAPAVASHLLVGALLLRGARAAVE